MGHRNTGSDFTSLLFLTLALLLSQVRELVKRERLEWKRAPTHRLKRRRPPTGHLTKDPSLLLSDACSCSFSGARPCKAREADANHRAGAEHGGQHVRVCEPGDRGQEQRQQKLRGRRRVHVGAHPAQPLRRVPGAA